jgi:hypothetical protein
MGRARVILRRRDRPRSARRVATASACFLIAGLVSSLSLLAPASAGSASVATIIHAPYSGSTWLSNNTTMIQGCGHASYRNPSWDPRTGVGHLFDSASAAPCPSTGGPSYGYAHTSIQIEIPVSFLTSGAHTLVVHWTVWAVGHHKALTLGSCVKGTTSVYSCDQGAAWNMQGDARLEDRTNGSAFHDSHQYWFWGNNTYTSTYCPGCYNQSGGHPSGHGGVVSFVINATLNRSHTYVLVTYLFADVEANFNAFQTTISGGSGSASVNAWGPHKITLKNIVVT